MNIKTTLILLVLLAAVGVYFLVVERHSVTTYELEQQQASQGDPRAGVPLFSADRLPTEWVGSLTLDRAGQPTVGLVKQGPVWRQVEPVRFDLESWSVRQVVDEAASLRYAQRFTPGQDGAPTAEQVDLSPPRWTVTLAWGGDQPGHQAIHVGRIAVGGRAYVRVNDDPTIYVVNTDLHRRLADQTVWDWRKKTLDAPGQGRSDRVTLYRGHREHRGRGGQTIEMVKNQGRWSFGPPLSGRVDPQAVDDLLGAVGSLYISRFEADNPPDLSVYGLDEGAETVVLTVHSPSVVGESDPTGSEPTNGDGKAPSQQADVALSEVHTLRIGAPVDLSQEAYFAGWSEDSNDPVGAVFVVSKQDVQRLNRSVDDLRQAKITPLKADDVREMTLTDRGGDQVKLVRGVGGWAFAEPGPGFDADESLVSVLVEALTQAQAVSYRAQATVEGEPRAVVTLAAIGQAEPEVLRVFAEGQDDRWLVLRNQETTGYVVEAERLKGVFDDALALRRRVVWDVTADGVQGLTIDTPDGVSYVFERELADASAATQPSADEGVAWRLKGQDRFEQGALNDLLSQLLPLRAQRWLKGPAEVPEGVAVHVAVRTVGVETGESEVMALTMALTVDPRTGQAVAQGVGAPFVVSRELVRALGAEFRDRTALDLAIRDVRSITVTGQGRSVTVQREESGRYTTPAPGSPGSPGPPGPGIPDSHGDGDGSVDQAVAGGLFDALCPLRVERHLSAGSLEAVTTQGQVTVEVQTKGGRTHRLVLPGPGPGAPGAGVGAEAGVKGQEGAAVLDGERWVVLGPEVVGAIKAPLADRKGPPATTDEPPVMK